MSQYVRRVSLKYLMTISDILLRDQPALFSCFLTRKLTVITHITESNSNVTHITESNMCDITVC